MKALVAFLLLICLFTPSLAGGGADSCQPQLQSATDSSGKACEEDDCNSEGACSCADCAACYHCSAVDVQVKRDPMTMLAANDAVFLPSAPIYSDPIAPRFLKPPIAAA